MIPPYFFDMELPVIVSNSASATDLSTRAVNLVNCGVIVLDANQQIILWNSWMVPRSGRSASRVRDRSLFDVCPELRGSRVEWAVLAALIDDVSTNLPHSESSAPFPLRQAGSFDGPRIDHSVSVVPFKEGEERFCMIEIRDVSGTVDRERQLLDHAESLRARSYVDGLTGIREPALFRCRTQPRIAPRAARRRRAVAADDGYRFVQGL